MTIKKFVLFKKKVLDKNSYLNMQKKFYDEEARHWNMTSRNAVVGSYDEHNKWADYDKYLFKDFDTKGLRALEYGCGPGRNLVKFQKRFEFIDGIDISLINLEKAKVNLKQNDIWSSNLYHTSGDNLAIIKDSMYDVVFSVICFQHIAVHEIRFNIFKDIFRVLKPGGKLCFQMGFGGKSVTPTANYYDNFYSATETNGRFDVSIMDETDLRDDLVKKLKYREYKSDITSVGPGDNHLNWIWVQVNKGY